MKFLRFIIYYYYLLFFWGGEGGEAYFGHFNFATSSKVCELIATFIIDICQVNPDK